MTRECVAGPKQVVLHVTTVGDTVQVEFVVRPHGKPATRRQQRICQQRGHRRGSFWAWMLPDDSEAWKHIKADWCPRCHRVRPILQHTGRGAKFFDMSVEADV